MGQELWDWFLRPENQIFCMGILLALILGLIIGRWSRQLEAGKTRALNREGNEAFFKGIQYMLSDAHDQAIEEFTKSVQVNSDTIETYVALGNLYRSKGDMERAIRIRQNIILRPNIDEQIKLRALYDLGLDYRKGGFLNRALETFLKTLQKQPESLETLEEIEKIYEEMKDWENAFATRKRIAQRAKGDHNHILAHHLTELGKAFQGREDLAKAKSCLKKAISMDEGCVDAYLHLGDLYFSQQEYGNAMATWKKVVKIAPRLTFLAYRRLEGAYVKMKNLKPVEDFLKECTQFNLDAFTHLALARYLDNENDHDGALRELGNALNLDPSFWEARKFMGEILISQDRKEEALEAYRVLIPHLDVPYLKFQCNNCGFIPNELQWQCPQCKKWDTIDLMTPKTTDPIPSRSPQETPQDSPARHPERDI